MNNISLDHKFIFIAGLHRSGTTILAECLKEHPLISGFNSTGHPKDEGQFLQSVYPVAKQFGGPGKFGFCPEMHLTEHSPLVTPQNRNRIFDEWSCHWNLDKPILLEKSPPNILKTRFLQALFPNSYFIFICRHPVATSYATQKWSNTSISNLFKHWALCHEIYLEDKKSIHNLFTLTYEQFVEQPDKCLTKIYRFLKVKSHPSSIEVKKDMNLPYFKKWQDQIKRNEQLKESTLNLRHINLIRTVKKFGYRLF